MEHRSVGKMSLEETVYLLNQSNHGRFKIYGCTCLKIISNIIKCMITFGRKDIHLEK